MTRFFASRTAAAAFLLVLAVSTLVAACSSAGPQTVRGAEAVSMLSTRTVIDVRTPGEYAAGHLAGAINIDVEASDFSARIASLDKSAPYLVYCHSGRRSAIAAKTMTDAGFTDVADGGGMSDLVAAGAPVQ